MQLVGTPKQAASAVKMGMDIIGATGTEAGGHTGEISTMVLLPQCADICKGTKTILVGGGGIFDGRGAAACLTLGA